MLRRVFVHILAAGLGVAAAVADLPPSIQADLDELHAKLDRIERQIAGFSPELVEQSLAEAKGWIDEFALDAELFDDDPVLVALRERAADLQQRAAAAAKERMKRLESSKPDKSASRKLEELLKLDVDLENVSFKRDVAPLIAESCLGCHNANRASGDFDAGSYQTFMEHIEPGRPEESHILNLVSGRSQPRMPRGGGGFSPQALEIWAAWVKAGARFDGPSETAPISAYLVDADAKRREVIRSLSPGQLEELHALAAQRQLDLVQPQRPVYAYETPNFLVRTTLDERDAEYIAVLAEAVLESLLPRYKLPSEARPWPGRLGLIAFRDRYDYIAFARLVDGHAPEPSEFGHVRLRPEFQYVALGADAPGATLDQLVAQQTAAAFFRTLEQGKMPDWAVHGNARTESIRWDPASAPHVQEELRAAAALAAQGRTAANVWEAAIPWVEAAPIATSVFTYVDATSRAKAAALNRLLAAGRPAPQAVREALGVSPEQFQAGWSAWAVKRHGKNR